MDINRVCLVKSTGKLIEYQSNATKGTLIKNALNAGYKLENIEEKKVTKKEWEEIKKEQIIDPLIIKKLEIENIKNSVILKFKNLGLADDEIKVFIK